jgi:phosphoribosylformylglycinamidine synthase II
VKVATSALHAAATELGLTDAETDLIVELLGREPNTVELAMLSVLWSEHCSYKHSKPLLQTLPTHGTRLLMGPGENAGAVDVGDGWAVAFKVESHNHPSAVEPFQGAATGVGGILRDIFAVGARPIAVLDSLRFGEPTSARTRYLLDRVVAGIGHYGNSIGVPTVGGEVYFEAPYEQNCLVNAMCIGLARADRMIRSAAAGPGNLLLLFGSATGRDGIGGASVLASAEFGEGDEGKRPTVQIGDPFAEKKVMEVSLELLERDLLVALQDLGAAGLTSSVPEMASKGGVGIDIDLAKVPLREADMDPHEVMVSESQERMVAIVEPAKLEAVLAVCAHWEVAAAVIGEVTDSGHIRVHAAGEPLADLPLDVLVDGCPIYELSPAKPSEPIYPPPTKLLESDDANQILLTLLASANIADRRYLYEQYDCIVGSRTIRRPASADAAVLLLPNGRALATAIDCNGRRVAADPYRGTLESVLECAANLACVGAEPLGVTNNLNFGNPEKPHVAWQLTESVRALADACRALDIPVVGGNVSLYNESTDGPIYPTPVIGLVGELLGEPARAAAIAFAREGDAIAVLGAFEPELAASELAKLRGEPLPDGLPEVDLGAACVALAAVRAAVRSAALSSAHDIAEGGFAVALAECCLAGGLGATIELDDADDATLFGEAPGGFIVSGPADSLPGRIVGAVGGDRLRIGGAIDLPLAQLREAHAALAALFA